MAKDAELKLILDTSEAVAAAKKAGKDIESALSVAPKGNGAITNLKKELRSVTNETAKSAKETRQKMDEYGTSIENVADKAKHLKEVKNNLKSTKADIGKLTDEKKALPDQKGIDAEALRSKIDAKKSELGKLKAESKEATAEFNTALEQAGIPLDKVEERFTAIKADADAVIANGAKAESIIQKIKDEAQEVSAATRQTTEEQKQQTEETKKTEAATENLNNAKKEGETSGGVTPEKRETGKTTGGDTSETAKKTGEAATKALGPIAQLVHNIDTLRQSGEDTTIELGQLEGKLSAMFARAQSAGELNANLRQIDEAFKLINSDTATSQRLADVFTVLTQAAMPAKQALSDVKAAAKDTGEGALAEARAMYAAYASIAQELEADVKPTIIATMASVSEAEKNINMESAKQNIAGLVRELERLKGAKETLEGLNIPPETDATYNKIIGLMATVNQRISEYKHNMADAGSSSAVSFEAVKSSVGKVTSGIKQGFSVAQRVVTKAVGVMRSAVSGFVKIAKSGFNAISKTVNKVKSSFNGMAGNMKSNFKHMITSITKYVFGFRSLFFLVRRLRKYIGEGIQGMAQFNKGSNPVNANISKLLTSLEYLKNAWSTAFDPILQFVTPWLSALIDKLADAGNAFSRFLGDLLGASEVFQAVKGPTKNYAKSLDKAGKSAGGAAKKQKKLNDRLADFDDLHVLGKDNDNKGSGGGSGSGSDDEDKKRNNKLWDFTKVGKDLQKALKDMWTSADFTALGKKISDGLSKALDNIPWSNIKAKAYKIGKSIATFLNGALGDKKLWESVGTAIGEGVNTLMELLKGFLENNKVDFGGNFAKLINKLFETIDWNTVKENIKSFVDMLIKNINSFLTTLDKSKIGEGVTTLSEGITYFISHAISDIKWGELWGLLTSVGGSIIDGIVEGFSQSDNPFLKAISGLLGSVKKAFEEGDATVAASGLTTFFKNVFANIKFEDIFNTLKEFFGKLFSDLFSTLSVENGNGFGQLFQSLQMVAQTIGNIFSAIINLLPQIMPSILQVTDASMNLFNALLPIVTAILPVIGNLVGYVTQIISSVLVPVLQILTPIIQFVCDILNLIMPIFDDIVGLINEVFGSLTVIIEPLTSLLKELLTPISAILQPIMSILKIVFKLVGDILSPIMELLAPLMEILTELLKPIFHVLTIIGDIISAIFVPILQVVANIIRAIIIPIINALIAVFRVVAGVLQNVGEVFSALFNAIRETLEDVKKTMVKVVNWIADKIEWLVNAIIGGINAAIGLINKVHIKVPDGIPIIGGKEFGFKIKELKTISIPRLAQGAVIPPNNEFLAMLGDQSHGTNIEAPLDTIKQAVAEVLATNGNQEVIQLLQQLIAVVESKNLVIGDKAIGQANARYTNQQRIIRGTSF